VRREGRRVEERRKEVDGGVIERRMVKMVKSENRGVCGWW